MKETALSVDVDSQNADHLNDRSWNDDGDCTLSGLVADQQGRLRDGAAAAAERTCDTSF